MTAEQCRKKFENDQKFGFSFPRRMEEMMIKFAQYHVKEALKAASKIDFESVTHPEADDYTEAIKLTIMECYSKKNIK